MHIDKKRMQQIVAVLCLLIFALVGSGSKKDTETVQKAEILPAVKTVIGVNGIQETFLRVIRVVDGDTFVVYRDGKEEKVRLIGVDTPEVVDPRKPVQCFGREASNKAEEMLTDAYVRLEADATQSDRDKYGRLLRYAYLEDGTLFNEYMIREGYAHEYTYQIPYSHQKEFKGAEHEARINRRGLWADGVCDIDKKAII